MPKGKHAEDRFKDFEGQGAKPISTAAVPGTNGRLDTYAARVRARQALFAEGDTGYDEDDPHGPLGAFVPNGKPANSGKLATLGRPDDLPADFGARLRVLRRRQGLSLRRLAERIGCDHSFVVHLEQGKRLPSVDTALALAGVLDVSLDVLLGTRS